MADFVKGGEDDELSVDLDLMFHEFLPHHDNLHFFDVDSSSSPNLIPSLHTSLSISQIQEFLLNDDDTPHSQEDSNHPQLFTAADAFLSDILLDSPLPLDSSSSSPSPSPSPSSRNLSPDNGLNSTDQDEQPDLTHPQEDNHDDNNHVAQYDHATAAASADPIDKKRKRQLRNKDAAVRSRERKKVYVKDLEMKSRYFEAECRRLGMLLQCYLADNHSLRLSLQNNSQAFGASTTKQESAVLLLESLLLGSLLWFLGIISLVILPRQLLSILEAARVENADSKNQGSLGPREAGSNVFGTLEFQSFMMSKRCRGSRRKMRCSMVMSLRNSLNCSSPVCVSVTSSPASCFI